MSSPTSPASPNRVLVINTESLNNRQHVASPNSPATTVPTNMITQVSATPQQTAQQRAAKSSLEAAKRRVSKLQVATSLRSPSSINSPTSGGPPTPEPPSPHTVDAYKALQTGMQKSSSIPDLRNRVNKKKDTSQSSNGNLAKKSRGFWNVLFPCCTCGPSASDDTVQVQMTPIVKQEKPPSPSGQWLLPPKTFAESGKKCLVLDLDETLVHSSFKPVPNADFVIPVEIDKTVHNVFVLKRPGVDAFLERIGPQYEVVVFTASLSKYADPVLDILDKHRVVKHRLFRESCIHHKGNYVKDLSLLGRDLRDVIIIDNSPACYMFHPANAIPISSWFDDETDTELAELVPFLEDLKYVEDVMLVLDQTLDESFS